MMSGIVLPDGTQLSIDYHFKDELDPIITREQLIRINEPQFGGPGRQYTEKVILPFLMLFFRRHVDTYGWFYPRAQTLDDACCAVRRSVARVTDVSVISSTHGAGTRYLKSRFKSYWNVDKGPIKSFWDDRKFEKVLRYRLGLNNSKMYEYTLSDGTVVNCHETFDINIKNVRFGLIVQRNSVSFFKPHAAGVIYRHVLGDMERPVVWDPSCGFGARLLGFMSMYPQGTYIGTEPATQTFADMMTMRDDVARSSTYRTLSIDLHRMGSEKFSGYDDMLDMVFTSPPYFEREKYFDEPGQCWRDYPDKDGWFNGYLFPTMQNAARSLKRSGRVVINIDNDNREFIERAADKAGLELYDELRLKTGRDHFNRMRGHTVARTEPILFFKKR